MSNKYGSDGTLNIGFHQRRTIRKWSTGSRAKPRTRVRGVHPDLITKNYTSM